MAGVEVSPNPSALYGYNLNDYDELFEEKTGPVCKDR